MSETLGVFIACLGFFGFLQDPHVKFEQASELFTNAANLYKIAKKWREAGDCFCESGQAEVKQDRRHEAATKYFEASNCYKKCDFQAAVDALQTAAGFLTESGRFAIAAKHLMSVGEIYEKDIVDLDKAMDAYQQAADYFKGEESGSSANKALIKVAHMAAQGEKYDRAVEIFEEVATQMVDNQLLKWSAKEYFLKAGLCRMCMGDFIGTKVSSERYEGMYAGFRDTRENKLLKDLSAAGEENNADKLTAFIQEYDAISPLDPWMTTILLRIKRSLTTTAIDL